MMRDIKSYRGRLQNPTQAERYAARFESGSRKRISEREQRVVQKIFSGLDCDSVLDVPSGAGRFVSALANGSRTIIEMDAALPILGFAR